MCANYIISAILGSLAIALCCRPLHRRQENLWRQVVTESIARKEWWEETDKKFQAWPPVVTNPISRQNFIVKSPDSCML